MNKVYRDPISWLICACLILIIWILAEVHGADARTLGCRKPPAHRVASFPREYPVLYRALRRHFGGLWREAMIVSYGESTWHHWARNGQYRGLFQMGATERRKTGWTSDVNGQVRASALWNRMNGGRWSKWDCKPW